MNDKQPLCTIEKYRRVLRERDTFTWLVVPSILFVTLHALFPRDFPLPAAIGLILCMFIVFGATTVLRVWKFGGDNEGLS